MPGAAENTASSTSPLPPACSTKASAALLSGVEHRRHLPVGNASTCAASAPHAMRDRTVNGLLVVGAVDLRHPQDQQFLKIPRHDRVLAHRRCVGRLGAEHFRRVRDDLMNVKRCPRLARMCANMSVRIGSSPASQTPPIRETGIFGDVMRPTLRRSCRKASSFTTSLRSARRSSPASPRQLDRTLDTPPSTTGSTLSTQLNRDWTGRGRQTSPASERRPIKSTVIPAASDRSRRALRRRGGCQSGRPSPRTPGPQRAFRSS